MKKGEVLSVLVFFLLLLWGAGAAKTEVTLDEGRAAPALVATEAALPEPETEALSEAVSEPESERASEEESMETEAAARSNAYIPDIDLLDTTVIDWGLGRSRDESGRPVDAVNAQERYGDYNAIFLGEEDRIYLTFDEGYEYGLTESLLDTLKEKEVKAVFFVTEHYAKTQPELVQRIIDDGHVLGNHSATHPSEGLTALSEEAQQKEVMENHAYVLEHFGYEMYLFRYPSGRFNQRSLAIVSNCNYKSVFWSFAYVDYDVENQPDPAESLAKLEERLHPGAVYLLHAESETNASILGTFIDYIREQGYSFGTF